MAARVLPSEASVRLLDDFSLEMTGKDVEALHEAAPLIPDGSRINVTFLGTEGLDLRLAATRAILEHGFIPVPHIAARRLSSATELEDLLAALQEIGSSAHLFLVGGDPAEAHGPYESSLDLIRTGLLPGYGVREASIAGYPEGHPDIATDVIWSELMAKVSALAEQRLSTALLTQFSFDVDSVVEWVAEVRRRGIEDPIRIGTPGPAGIKRLLGFARRFGIGTNATIVKKYGFSLTNLMGTAGPDHFVSALADELVTTGPHGPVSLHFYTFGGLTATARWARDFAGRRSQSA